MASEWYCTTCKVDVHGSICQGCGAHEPNCECSECDPWWEDDDDWHDADEESDWYGDD